MQMTAKKLKGLYYKTVKHKKEHEKKTQGLTAYLLQITQKIAIHRSWQGVQTSSPVTSKKQGWLSIGPKP